MPNNINKNSFKLILNKLSKNEIFSFTRFGDGDYLIMFDENVGEVIGNSNKFIVTKKLQQEIIEAHSIEDENYVIGSVLKTNAEDNILYTYNYFLDNHKERIKKIGIPLKNLISAVALTETFVSNVKLFSKLVIQLRKNTTMFVGANYHNNLKDIYGNITHIVETQPTNCYVDVDEILSDILKNIDKSDKIIFSCGFTARVLIKRLWDLGIKKTMIDVGSLSDYFILETALAKHIKLRGHIVKHRNLIENNYYKLHKILQREWSMFGGFAIDVECYLKILEILPAGKTILELGSGYGTKKLAESYKMYSIEHNELWVDKYDSTYILAPIEIESSEDPPINWYNVSAIKKQLPKHYDMILVDGPIGGVNSNVMARDGFRRNKHLFNLEDTIILFDDVQRRGELASMFALTKELNRKYKIFNSGTKEKPKQFAIIYP